jgi:outer membrane protein assembly factor BamA
MRAKALLLTLFFLMSAYVVYAQADSTIHKKVREKDLIDVLGQVTKNPAILKHDTITKKSGRLHFSFAPGLGYSLSSGFGAIIAGNTGFFASEDPTAKISNIYADVVYTQKSQLILHAQGNMWTKNNDYNIVNDWRYLKYPQATYGLGGNSQLANSVDQDYSYVRLYQSILRNLGHDLFAGIGYSLDYHWNVTETKETNGTISDSQLYGLQGHSTSSGINFNFLYDSRMNSINPSGGSYVNILYRPNLTALGSDSNWQMLRIDLRKYVAFPRYSENVLAFWSFNWLTPKGNPPYLDLPSTGWDPYNNSGRGYIQGRFRGKNMLYLETEYRFKITSNGLFGGVVFVNAQSFSSWPGNKFQNVAPAAGFGLRSKFNKHSKTNVAIDYGFGKGGSQGFFLNLGEVF